MTNKEALIQAYKILSPYSNKQLWEFNNNLIHLNFLTRRVSKDQTIFDAGCGIGILALALTLLAYEVEGGDKYLFLSNNNFTADDIQGLGVIWEKHNLRITSKDIITDIFGKQYDIVVSVATIEHQQDPKEFLRKIASAVRKDGHIYIATPNISHLLNRIRFLFGRSPLSGNLESFFNQGKYFTGHWREYTLDELEQMFKLCGLKVVKAKNIQSMAPRLGMKNLREIYVNLFRLLAYLAPGAKDTNIVFGRK